MPIREDLNTLKVYHDYYGTQVQFDASRAAFWFDEAVLDIKIPSADAVTFAVYEAKCLAELERLQQDEQTPTVVQRVQDYLEIQSGLMPAWLKQHKH